VFKKYLSDAKANIVAEKKEFDDYTKLITDKVKDEKARLAKRVSDEKAAVVKEIKAYDALLVGQDEKDKAMQTARKAVAANKDKTKTKGLEEAYQTAIKAFNDAKLKAETGKDKMDSMKALKMARDKKEADKAAAAEKVVFEARKKK